MLTDLSKALDCLNHELFITKLNAYVPASKLACDYLSDRELRTRVNKSYITWFEIISRVPLGSIIGSMLFNIFLTDLFFILSKTDIANYTNDKTPYTSSNDINCLIKSLKEASKELFKCLTIT